MSSPAEELLSSELSVERRFYARTAPSSFVSVAFGEDNPGMLLNLSENGLLVATPIGLTENFVCRVSLPLNGLLRPIDVLVRVIWTQESKRAGIQLLDLCDYDREQIRKWAAVEESRRRIAEHAQQEETEVPGSQQEPAQAVAAEIEAPQNAEVPRKKSFPWAPLAACGASVALLCVIGAALWASPMRTWLTNSVGAGLEPMAKPVATNSRTGAGAPANVQEVEMKTQAQSADAAALRAQKKEEASDREAADGAEVPTAESAESMNPAETATKADLSGKSSVVRVRAASAPKQPATTVAAMAHDLTISGARHARSRKAGPDSITPSNAAADGRLKQPDAAIDGAAPSAQENSSKGSVVNDSSTGDPALDANHANDAPTVSPPSSASAAPVNPGSPVAGTVGFSPTAKPAVIQTDAPKNQVLEVTLPNGARPSFLSLPGEKIVQSDAVTLHIERSILTPPVRGWWTGERKKKVVLGDLLSRVDPRLPRRTEEAAARVSVRAILGKDGHVERLMPVNGSAALVPSVVRAVREWRFAPTLVDGKPVETGALVLVEFRSPARRPAAP